MHAELVPINGKPFEIVVYNMLEREYYPAYELRVHTEYTNAWYYIRYKLKIVPDDSSDELNWIETTLNLKIQVKPMNDDQDIWPYGAICEYKNETPKLIAKADIFEGNEIEYISESFRFHDVAVDDYGLSVSYGIGPGQSAFYGGWNNGNHYTVLSCSFKDDLGNEYEDQVYGLDAFDGVLPMNPSITKNDYLFFCGEKYTHTYVHGTIPEKIFVRSSQIIPSPAIDPRKFNEYEKENQDGNYVIGVLNDSLISGTIDFSYFTVNILDLSDDSVRVSKILYPPSLYVDDYYRALNFVLKDGSQIFDFKNERSYVISCSLSDIFMDDPIPICFNQIIRDGFMNVHLSSFKGGGVCFGGHSDSKAYQRAMFQCYYLSYFYGDIATHDVLPGDFLAFGHHGFEESSDYFFHGLTTAGTTSIYFSIPIRGKISEKVVDVSVIAFECWIMNSGGYGLSSSFKATADDYLPYLVQESLRIDRVSNTVLIEFKKSSGFNFTNNNAITARVSAVADDVPVYGEIVLYFSDEYQYDSLSTSSATASTTYSSSYPVSNLFNPNKSTVWASKGTDAYPTLTFTFAREYYGIHLEFYSRDNATLGWSPEYITMSAWLWSYETADYDWVEIGSIEDIDVEEHSGGYIGSLEIDSSICTSKILLSMKKADIANYVAMGYIGITAQIRKGL